MIKNINFYKEKCSPCNGNTPKLNKEEVLENMKFINDWTVNDKNEMIFKKFKFKNFNLSINFVNKVSVLAEEEGHHPDISFGYSYCIIFIHTHAIKGLSLNDFILASKIDKID